MSQGGKRESPKERAYPLPNTTAYLTGNKPEGRPSQREQKCFKAGLGYRHKALLAITQRTQCDTVQRVNLPLTCNEPASERRASEGPISVLQAPGEYKRNTWIPSCSVGNPIPKEPTLCN